MCTFNVKNGASLMVAFYISISFSILVSLSKDLLQCSFSNLERSEFEKIISRNKMEDSVETYLQEFSFCSNFRRTKMKNKYFRRHENREKEKCRWFVCNLTPSSIRFFFFLFLFLSITIIGDFSWDTSVVSLCPEVENRSRYRHFARLHAYRVRI